MTAEQVHNHTVLLVDEEAVPAKYADDTDVTTRHVDDGSMTARQFDDGAINVVPVKVVNLTASHEEAVTARRADDGTGPLPQDMLTIEPRLRNTLTMAL